MNGKRTAVIVSHPAHLLTVAGMLLRWQPHVLIVYRSVTGGGVGQEEAIRPALVALGVADRTTSLAVSETESFDRALAGDFSFHVALGERLFDWLRTVQPDVVLGDAYEAYNFHHDAARVMIDAAVEQLRRIDRQIENYEFPLSCRVDRPGSPVQYGVFAFGEFNKLTLTADEVAIKRELVEQVGRVDSFVAKAAAQFADPGVEMYREVPVNRDYTAPPPGLALFYDEQGRRVVEAGRFAHPILFRQHFVPMVHALGLKARVEKASPTNPQTFTKK